MKINRVKFLKQLKGVSAGLAALEVLEQQSTCFVFQDGKVKTFNDEVACVSDSLLSIEGAIQSKSLLALLNKLTEEEIDIELDESKNELVVKGKRRWAELKMEQSILLPVDSVEKPKEWQPLNEDFVDAVSVVSHCASKDNSKFVMTCIQIEPDCIIACDYSQVCRYSVKTGITKSILIRQEALKRIVGLDMVELAETENWIHFRNKRGLSLSCRLYMDEYLDVSDIFKEEPTEEISFPEDLEDVVKKAEIFSSGEGCICVELKNNKMRVTGQGENGKYVEQKKVLYDGKSLKFQIDSKLLLEIINRKSVCKVAKDRLFVVSDKWKYVASTVL